MTHLAESNVVNEVVQVLAERGFDGLAEVLEVVLNEAMKIERSQTLGARPFERTPERRGHANGFKPKTVLSRLGKLRLAVPQTRDVPFYPSALERGERSERALKVALAEMYVQGVSTRKVKSIVEELCGSGVSSTQVSRCAAELDDVLTKWRDRPLGAYPFLILDARYEKVRHGGSVVDCAVLVAVGIGLDGKRSILGVSVKLSEAEVHWREFLGSLTARGLHGVELIVSDGHAGLKEARQACFPSVPWQRCQFHLLQNAMQYVPHVAQRAEVAADLRAVFHAPSREEAERLIRLAVEKYERSAPRLAEWIERNVPEGLTVLSWPVALRRRLRTTNLLERLNKEIKRRTRVATLFPNEASLLRLVTAILMETSEEWETGKIYLNRETV
jgi:transposase-like protein